MTEETRPETLARERAEDEHAELFADMIIGIDFDLHESDVWRR